MLKNEPEFFNALRKGVLGPTLEQNEVDGVKAVIEACSKEKWPLSWAAYALATAYHETAGTMKPVKEYGGDKYYTKMYDVAGTRPKLAIQNGNTCAGDGPKYCGRGYVQLTWKNNYAKASKKCGVDLVAHPDLAMDLGHAATIMTSGMEEGWFTGKSLKTFLGSATLGTRDQFIKCRYIINGTDKADKIADHALEFQKALQVGQWQP